MYIYMVESLNNETDHLVHYRELVLFQRQNVLPVSILCVYM